MNKIFDPRFVTSKFFVRDCNGETVFLGEDNFAQYLKQWMNLFNEAGDAGKEDVIEMFMRAVICWWEVPKGVIKGEVMQSLQDQIKGGEK